MTAVTLWHVAVLVALAAVNVAVFGVPGLDIAILVWLGVGR